MMVEKPIFSICASDEFFKSLYRITSFKSSLRLNRLTIQYHVRREAIFCDGFFDIPRKRSNLIL